MIHNFDGVASGIVSGRSCESSRGKKSLSWSGCSRGMKIKTPVTRQLRSSTSKGATSEMLDDRLSAPGTNATAKGTCV